MATTRRELLAADLSPGAGYHLMTATIIPRPIAWISTISADGVDNLAPHSFYTVASAYPPIVQFTSVGNKDTLRNVEQTGEMVINLCSEDMLEQVNASSIDLPPERSEFDYVPVEREPSLTVRPPRVAGSPVAIECTLERTIPIGNCTVVWGNVTCFAIDESVLDVSDERRPHPLATKLAPLARLGKDEWSTLGQIIDLRRPRYEG